MLIDKFFINWTDDTLVEQRNEKNISRDREDTREFANGWIGSKGIVLRDGTAREAWSWNV